MQIEVSQKIEEMEKEIRSLQMQIDLLDHKLNTLKQHFNKWKGDLVDVHG